MKESAKGKHEGNKNSQYETCWIMKDKQNKKIKKRRTIKIYKSRMDQR